MRTAKITVYKLNRRIRAIKEFLDKGHRGGKEPGGLRAQKWSPLMPLLYAYAREKKVVEERMAHSGMRFDDPDKIADDMEGERRQRMGRDKWFDGKEGSDVNNWERRGNEYLEFVKSLRPKPGEDDDDGDDE